MRDELKCESLSFQLGKGLCYALCFNAVLLGLMFLCLLTNRPLQSLTVVVGFVIGTALGSFINHLFYRIRKGIPLLRPANHCPVCRVTIKALHNVPIVGWLIVRGRCAGCRTQIPVRYLLAEMCGGLFCAMGALALGA